jgi:manganese/zinc/iron transport system substrate-binding protein
MKHLITMILLGLIAMITVACGGIAQSESEDEQLSVLTTTGHIADAARIVGGDHVNVVSLMGPGTDPHLYTASASDVDKLRDADVVFYNGLFLEAQLEDVLEQLATRKTVVPVSIGIDESRLLASADYAGEFDPHVWFDVNLWMAVVEQVRDTLKEADPTHATEYDTNAATYLAELQELHSYVTEQAARVPQQQRVLITAHDAFNYFGRAYDFEVMGLQGISTASEASTADVQRLANFIAENQIPAIFIESSVPVRTIEAVQAAVRSRGYEVAIGGELFSDAMGNAGTPEGTYLGMVRHNIDTIVGALMASEQ